MGQLTLRRLPRVALHLACVATATLLPVALASAGSPKKGMGGGTAQMFEAINAGWYYNWGLTPAAGTTRAEFVPMYWNYISDASSLEIKNNPNVKTVLGFNEPERPDQANLTVDQAIAMWPKVVATGKYVVSPAVSDGGNGRPWLQEFMTKAAAANLKVDAVAFHWYGNINTTPSAAASSFFGAVDWYWNTFKKPVWITEFGGLYNGATAAQNEAFVKAIMPGLESRSYIEKFAYWNWSAQTKIIDDVAPYTPATPVGDAYTGTVFGTGQTFDLRTLNTGADRYYLKGGTITNSGGRNDSMSYLDAVSGVSTISGASQRWDINGGGKLVIREGATLQKQGVTTVSLNGTNVQLDGALVIQAGTLQIEGGTIITPRRGSLLRLEAGILSLTGMDAATAINLPGTIELRGGTVRSANATQTISGGTTLYNTTEINTVGRLDYLGFLGGSGALTKTGGAILRLTNNNTYAGGTVVNDGTLWADNTGTATVTGAGPLMVGTLGTLAGDARIAGAATVSGKLSPGAPGTTNDGSSLRFASTLTLGSTATSIFDLVSATDHDAALVTGAATLGGTLQLRVSDLYVPTLGTQASILTAASLTGKFATITGVVLNDSQSLAVTYDDTGVRVTVARSGDATLDGLVNFDDLLTLSQNYQTTGRDWLEADFTGNRSVDFDDLLVLAQNYGAGEVPAGLLSASFAADWALAQTLVPEPASLALLAILLTPMRRSRR